MSDTRSNRGPHPKDRELFASEQIAALRSALHDFSWLLSRGYARPSSLKLVGDRYGLRERQRVALGRAACGDEEVALRKSKEVGKRELKGVVLAIDGFNLITTIEAALGGGLLLRCRDGCIRDVASMHGSYRKVAQTQTAIDAIGGVLSSLEPERCDWFLDQPVSNSGRLKTILLETAESNGWNWTVELVMNPDRVLKDSPAVAITSDSIILNECERWFNLTPQVLEQHVPAPWLIDLGH